MKDTVLPLLSSYNLGIIPLANRFVMAPMTRSRAINNVPNELMATYYAQRSNAGLIITEGTSPSPNGLGYARIPGIYSDSQVDGWKKVTRAVHQQEAKIFLQLMHCGRVAHPLNLPPGSRVLAPSPIRPAGQMYTDKAGMQDYPIPEEMTAKEIEQAKQEFVTAARNALRAGFDGVELHAANGYLLEQFLNPHTNTRSDSYGGSIQNRCKFVLEVTQLVANAIGKELVGIRLSPYGTLNDMKAYDDAETTYHYLTGQLNGIGIAYVHIVDHSSMGAPEVNPALKNSIRTLFNGTYILSGGYETDRAIQDLESGKGDLVAFGRKYLANPDLIERFRHNRPLNTPDEASFYTPGPEGYTDYPFHNAD